MLTLTSPRGTCTTEFRVRYLAYGTIARPARWCTVKVFADSDRDCLSTCKSRLRGERFQIISKQSVMRAA
jgi:hypothetical protein